MNSKITSQNDSGELFEDELKPGTKLLLGQYVIEQFLNNGGFGITYLAKDSLNRRVVIKECFPEAICRRNNATVRVRSRNQTEAFRTMVDLFIEEARNLARLSHPNIVSVHQVFEDNDTAYMAMDYVEGPDLLDVAEGASTFKPPTLERIVIKLLDAIEFIHNEGILHRDISPDNILLGKDNQPVLIDFGAARETVSRATRYLGAMRTVKDGYSPQEFYVNSAEQYPSSDLYSLGASLYHILTREVPVSAQERLSAIAAGDADPYVSIKTRVSDYPEPFLDAIDKALNVFPKKRLQSAAEWRAMITHSSISHLTRGTVSQPILAVDNGNILQQFEKTFVATTRPSVAAEKVDEAARGQAGKGASRTGFYAGAAVVALAAIGGAGIFMTGTTGDDAESSSELAALVAETASEPAASEPEPASSPWEVPKGLPAFMEQAARVEPVAPVTEIAAVPETESGGVETAAPDAEDDAAVADVEEEIAALPEDSKVRDASSVIVGRAIQFSVLPDPGDPTLVASSSGPVSKHLTPGLRLLSVNGFPIDSLDEFQRVAGATTDPAASDTVVVRLGIENPANGNTYVREAALPVVQQTLLLNGVSFQTTQDGEAWTTLVTTGTGTSASDLQAGDRIVALMPDNELIDTRDGLGRIIRREIGAGKTRFNFAVDRGGEMWFATMTYAARDPN